MIHDNKLMYRHTSSGPWHKFKPWVFKNPRVTEHGELAFTGVVSNETYVIRAGDWGHFENPDGEPTKPDDDAPWGLFLVRWSNYQGQRTLLVRAANREHLWSLVNNHPDVYVPSNAMIEEIGTALVDAFPKILINNLEVP